MSKNFFAALDYDDDDEEEAVVVDDKNANKKAAATTTTTTGPKKEVVIDVTSKTKVNKISPPVDKQPSSNSTTKDKSTIADGGVSSNAATATKSSLVPSQITRNNHSVGELAAASGRTREPKSNEIMEPSSSSSFHQSQDDRRPHRPFHHGSNYDRHTKFGRGGDGGGGGNYHRQQNRRAYDRRSGTGRGREVRKDGAGAHNWGSDVNEARQAEGPIAETAGEFVEQSQHFQPDDSQYNDQVLDTQQDGETGDAVDGEGNEQQGEEEAPAEEEYQEEEEAPPPPPEEDKTMTYEEYLETQRQQLQDNAAFAPVKERQLSADEFAGLKLKAKVNEDEDFFTGSGKNATTAAATTKRTRANKKEKQALVPAFRVVGPEDDASRQHRRGGGRGGEGRSGRGGGRFGGSSGYYEPREGGGGGGRGFYEPRGEGGSGGYEPREGGRGGSGRGYYEPREFGGGGRGSYEGAGEEGRVGGDYEGAGGRGGYYERGGGDVGEGGRGMGRGGGRGGRGGRGRGFRGGGGGRGFGGGRGGGRYRPRTDEVLNVADPESFPAL